MTILEQLNCTDSKIDWNLSDDVMLPRLNKDFELKVGVQEKRRPSNGLLVGYLVLHASIKQ